MNLENYTLVELRHLAKENGIKNTSKLKKEELIQILTDNKEVEKNTSSISESSENVQAISRSKKEVESTKLEPSVEENKII